jgi:hypothetical protein
VGEGTALVIDSQARLPLGPNQVQAAISALHALARAQRDGEVKRDLDVYGYARALVAVTQGLHVLARVETDSHRLHDAVDAALAPLEAIPGPRRSRTRELPTHPISEAGQAASLGRG